MQTSELEKNKAVIMRYVNEIQNGHSIDAIDSIFAENFVDHMATYGGLFQGIDGLKRGYSELLGAFPDLQVTVEDLIAEGDKVVVYKTATATHRGPYQGIPATGNRVQFENIYIFQIRDGKIVEYWGLFNEFALKQQLGAIAQDDDADSD